MPKGQQIHNSLRNSEYSSSTSLLVFESILIIFLHHYYPRGYQYIR